VKNENSIYKLKINFFLILFLGLSSVGSSQIWIDDFDGSNATNPYFGFDECYLNGESYFGIMCPSGGGCSMPLSAGITGLYSNLSGNFLGARNTDAGLSAGPCGPGDVEQAFWNNIDISSCSSTNSKLYLCFSVAESDDITNGYYTDPNAAIGWNEPASVSFSVEIDNAIGSTLGVIESNGSSPSYASWDLDCDGTGDGVYNLTPSYNSYCFQIPGVGNSLKITIAFNGLNQVGEDIAIDNIGVYCNS